MNTRASLGRLSLFFGCNVLFAAGLFSHALLYNFYLDGLGVSEGVMGGAAAALTAGGLTGLLPAGQVVDRVGARAAWVLASVFAAAGLALGAWVRSPATIYGAAFLAGFGTSAWRVAMGPLIMGLASEGSRTRAFSWNVALLLGAGAVWTAVSGAIPGWLERTLGTGGEAGVRVGLMAGAAATLAGAVLIGLLRVDGAAGGRAGIGRAAGGIGERARHRQGGFGYSAWLDRVRDRVGLPADVAVLVGLVALWMTAAALVLPFFNVYFLRVHGLGVGRIGLLFGAAQAVTALVVFAGGDLAARFGAQRMLLVWALPFAPFLWAMGGATTIGMAATLYLVQGFVPPATNPLIDQIVLERVPAGRHGAVSTWRNAATDGAGLIGAALGGALLERTSFPALFAVAGAIALAGALALATVLRRGGWRVMSAAPVDSPTANQPISD